MIDIPKFLVLQGDSDSMYDERVIGLIKHTLPAQQPLPALFQEPHTIHTMDYSNKYGIMVHCLDKDIGIKNIDILNQQFSKGEQQTHKLNFSFEGNPYIVSFSPDEEWLAVVTSTRIHIVKTSELKQSKVEHTTDTDQPITNLLWEGNNGVMYWKFLGKAYHYSLDRRSANQFPECGNCSCVQSVNNHYVVASTEKQEQGTEWVVKLYSQEFKRVGTVKYPQEAYSDSQCYYFNIADVVSITKLNNLTSQEFQASDIYSFITVYYQEDIDDQDLISGKNIFFAQGDLSTANVKFRDGSLLYSHRSQRDQYMGKQGQVEFKRSFGIKSCFQHKLNFFVSAIERSEGVYVVDLQSDFQNLKLADFPGKYEFKSGSTLVGFSLMKNMLELEEEYQGSNKDLNAIVTQFAGRFLNVGIKEKDKDMMVPFPVSILAYNCKGMQIKQYLVVTKPNVDNDDQQEVKLKQMGQIVGQCAIVQPLPLFQEEKYIKKRREITYKPTVSETRQVQKNLEQQNLSSQAGLILPPKPEGQKDPAPSLFGTNTNVFSNPNAMTGVNPTIPVNAFKSNNIFATTSNAPKNQTEGNTLNLKVPDISISGVRPNGLAEINPLGKKDKTLADTNTGISPQKLGRSSMGVPNTLSGMNMMPGQKRTDAIEKCSPGDKNQKAQQGSRGSEGNVQRCSKIISQKNKEMQGFLKYFNEPVKQNLPDKQFQKASSMKECMNSILSSLKKEELVIEINISQIEVSEGSRHKTSFSFNENSPKRAEELVQDKLREYQAITNRLCYLKNKFSAQKSSLNILKPVDMEEVVAKAIQLQTSKVDQLVRKSSKILEKSRDRQIDNRQALNNKHQGRYAFSSLEYNFQDQDGGSTGEDIAVLLSGFEPRVVKVEGKPAFNLKERQKENPRQKEKPSQVSKQSRGQVRLPSKRTLSFPAVIDESEEQEESRLDSEEQEELAFKEIPSIKSQISDIQGRTISQSSLSLGPKKQKQPEIPKEAIKVKKQIKIINDSKVVETKKQGLLDMDSLSKGLKGVGMGSIFPKQTKMDLKPEGGLQQQKKQSSGSGLKFDLFGKRQEEPKQKSGVLGGLFGKGKQVDLKVQTKPVAGLPQNTLFGTLKDTQNPQILKSVAQWTTAPVSSLSALIPNPAPPPLNTNKPPLSELKDVETAVIANQTEEQPSKDNIFGGTKPKTGGDTNKSQVGNLFYNKADTNTVPKITIPPQSKPNILPAPTNMFSNPTDKQIQPPSQGPGQPSNIFQQGPKLPVMPPLFPTSASQRQQTMQGSNAQVVAGFNPQPNASTLPQFGKSTFGASPASNIASPAVPGLPTSANIFGQGEPKALSNFTTTVSSTNIFSNSNSPSTAWPSGFGTSSNLASNNVNNQTTQASQSQNQQQPGNFLGLQINPNPMMGQNQSQGNFFNQQPQQPQSQPSWSTFQQNQTTGSSSGEMFKPRK